MKQNVVHSFSSSSNPRLAHLTVKTFHIFGEADCTASGHSKVGGKIRVNRGTMKTHLCWITPALESAGNRMEEDLGGGVKHSLPPSPPIYAGGLRNKIFKDDIALLI
jgi:hypothetical protein